MVLGTFKSQAIVHLFFLTYLDKLKLMNNLVKDPFNLLSDPNLAFLGDALSPDKVEQMFKQFYPWLVKNSSICSIEVIRYKPQKRCLIEYSFQGKNKISFLGKVRFKGTDTNSYYLQQYLWQNGFNDQSLDHVSVPEPVAIFPQWKMWLQRKVPGVMATDLLTTSEGINIAPKIAYTAHKLHQLRRESKRYHRIADELDILHQKLPMVSQLYPHWQTRINRILQQCDRLVKNLPSLPPLGIHRDFYPDQIIINGSRVYLLDLDLYCHGDPSLDIGNFLAHITEYSLRTLGHFAALKQQEIALENEFIKLAGEHTREPIKIYKLLTLVRHIFLSTQFPERTIYTEALMQLSEEQLINI